MSMFWIEFDPEVTEKDIIRFQNKFLNWQGNFCSNGSFVNIVSVADQEVDHHWRYMAATIEAADDDWKEWRKNRIKQDLEDHDNKLDDIIKMIVDGSDELNLNQEDSKCKWIPMKDFGDFNYANIALDITGVDRELLHEEGCVPADPSGFGRVSDKGLVRCLEQNGNRCT